MQILGKRQGQAILLAAGLALGGLATPANADHDSANLAPLAAFIAFGALLHHSRHHTHRHYYRHAPRHYHAPRRHSHSHGGYAGPGKHHGGHWGPGEHRGGHWGADRHRGGYAGGGGHGRWKHRR